LQIAKDAGSWLALPHLHSVNPPPMPNTTTSEV
jgi:hypothetical protein